MLSGDDSDSTVRGLKRVASSVVDGARVADGNGISHLTARLSRESSMNITVVDVAKIATWLRTPVALIAGPGSVPTFVHMECMQAVYAKHSGVGSQSLVTSSLFSTFAWALTSSYCNPRGSSLSTGYLLCGSGLCDDGAGIFVDDHQQQVLRLPRSKTSEWKSPQYFGTLGIPLVVVLIETSDMGIPFVVVLVKMSDGLRI